MLKIKPSIKKYITRVSVRDFDKKKINKSDLEIISKVINNAPTSTNSQQFSAIIITDPKIKKYISDKNWKQKHIFESAAFILFIADKTRADFALQNTNIKKDKKIVKHEFYRSIVDATIAATYTHGALMEMGYGVTFVGGIVTFAEELAKLLKIPDNAMPLLGLSFGKSIKKNPFKPKMDKVFINEYDENKNQENIRKYNKILKEYFAKRKNASKNEDFLKSFEKMYDLDGFMGQQFSHAGKYIIKKWKKLK